MIAAAAALGYCIGVASVFFAAWVRRARPPALAPSPPVTFESPDVAAALRGIH